MPLHFAVFSEKVWVCKFGSKNDKFPPKYLYNMKISVNVGPHLLHFMALNMKRANYVGDVKACNFKGCFKAIHIHKFTYLLGNLQYYKNLIFNSFRQCEFFCIFLGHNFGHIL